MIACQKKIGFIICDFLLFIAPSLVFNLLYVVKFQSNLHGGLLNIYLVFLIWLILTSLRLVLALFISNNKMPLINFILMSGFWISLVLFYLLCIVGLTSWSRVPTITMIKVYLSQISILIATLNMTVWMLVLFAVITLIILWVLYKMIWSKTLWLSLLAHKLRLGISLFTFFSIALIGIISFWQNFYYGMDKNEVFLEVCFPEFSAKNIQNWRVYSSKILETEANASRAHYKKSNHQPRNVILIVVDALRADHLSVNGYPRQTTPFIDSLRQNGTLKSISPVRSVCAESSCGLLAIARSKYPNSITSVDFSLYEVLKQYGYKNYFLLSGDHTSFYDLKKIFMPYDLYVDGSAGRAGLSIIRSGVSVNDDRFVINELKKLPPFNGTPTFIQFHLMSVHGLGLRFRQNYPFAPAKNYYNPIIIGANDKQRLAINYYDNGVNQTDTIIANIFSLLKGKGYLQNAIVVITGDHGELLGEKGLYAHSKTIEDTVLNVPFVVWSSKKNDPSLDFKKWPITSQVDIAPSILYAMNIRIPSSWQGTPLQKPPKKRIVFISQENEIGVYLDYKDTVFKLTLNKNTNVEQSYILNSNRLDKPELLKTIIPPNLLKEMRIKLYENDM